MLQLNSNNTIQESIYQDSLIGSGNGYCGLGQITYYPSNYPYTIPWQGYTVYVCTDKTKKAIEVLKHLQNQKLLICNSVNKFIELVEQISNIL